MATVPGSLIRSDVLNYLTACANRLADNPGSHDRFLIASQTLQQKKIRYTVEELRLVPRMLLRISITRGK